MALDSETKRRSMHGMGLMFLVIAPVPDGTLSSVDRLHIIGLPGAIAPAAPGVVTTAINIFGPAGAPDANHAADSGSNLLVHDTLEVKKNAYFGGAANFTNIDSSGNIFPKGNGSLVVQKAKGHGIKVDQANPTFTFEDILGDQFTKNTGATKPTLTTYNGAINCWKFGVGDEAFITYHIPHEHFPGSDIFLHVHWSHIGTLVTGGTITFKATSILAKAHNQAPFQSVPSVGTFTGAASTVQYQQILSEIQYSASSPTGLQVDTDNLEPDSVIELTFEVDANNITVSGGAVPDIYIHFVDLHYLSTGVGTKAKAPDFYV